ncbi:MAG TPA: cupin domain-containing protein [Thermoanaerobaculia bacterium]|nr:cupin domain-containing protein [Thermoanaerobaculia bacterium]
MRKHLLLGAAIAFAAGSILSAADEPAMKPMAHKKTGAMAKPVVTTPDGIKWGDAPPVLSPGAKFALVEGNPMGASGYYAVRLQIPDGYKIMPHWHPKPEHVTVISGSFNVGMGDKMDESATTALPAGSYGTMPAKMHHYAVAKGETVVQITGDAPFALTYVNAADDPSGMQGKKAAEKKPAK